MSSPATAVTSSRSFSSRPRRRAPGSTRTGSGRSSPRSRSRTASPSLHPSASRASRTTKPPTRRTFSAPPTRHFTPRSVLGRTRSPRQVRRRESHDMAQRDILIVDDDRQVREVLHQIFVAAGYNCLLANDGREGVEVFKAGRPPLVVTDLKMPGITGIDLLQQVRAVDDDVAVIVLTGAADVKTAINSLKLGAHAFIMKPVNMDELLIATERALERRQLLIECRQHQRAHGQRREAPREVLIVEHDRQIRELLREIFLSAGYTCLLASDGDKGLEMFRKARPPLIVTELNMPAPLMVTERNIPVTCGGEKITGAGIGLLRLVRQEDPDAAVLVLGGKMDLKIHAACLKLGAYAHLWKPVLMDELLIAAERAIERRQL